LLVVVVMAHGELLKKLGHVQIPYRLL